MKAFDKFLARLLKSPFHDLFMLSDFFTLLTVTGLKTNREYTFPVEYLQYGDKLYILSKKDRKWWKNVLCGAPVTLCLRGKGINAYARTYTNEDDVMDKLTLVILNRPMYARAFDVKRNPDGTLNQNNLRTAAQELVAVEVQLAPQPVLIGAHA